MVALPPNLLSSLLVLEQLENGSETVGNPLETDWVLPNETSP
jgi:hypothetical protein